MDNVFRAYDIRGIYNKDVNPALFLDIGLALGREGKTVCVGGDVRTTTPSLLNALIAGLLATGTKVKNAGITHFGETLFAGWREGVDETYYVTASHLPPEWNGLKLYDGRGNGFEEQSIYALRDRVKARQSKPVQWDKVQPLENVDYKDRYIKFMKEHFTTKPMKVVVDCGNGSASLAAPEALRAVGMDVVEIWCDVDPSFPNRPSEPTDETLSELKRTVVKEGAAFGVAFDGDGDRAVIVDNTGRTLNAGQVGAIIGKSILKNGGKVVVNVECPLVVEKTLSPLGEVIRIPVGHTFLTRHAEKEGAALGIEISGHMVMPQYFLFDDAMVVPLKLAEVLSENGGALSDLIDELHDYPNARRQFECDDEKKFSVVNKLKEKFSKEYEDVDTMDGIRVNLNKGWVLIRCSNTSPIIRLMAEAETDRDLASIVDAFSKELEEAMK
ncbi:MAG: phosphomannomutase/phosphoglucomutase [Candidatus Diapherotrites archaeon]|nr:phosphomannomutase/phosphoglucomutase [Candidatus Diapherotrites archaeon]